MVTSRGDAPSPTCFSVPEPCGLDELGRAISAAANISTGQGASLLLAQTRQNRRSPLLAHAPELSRSSAFTPQRRGLPPIGRDMASEANHPTPTKGTDGEMHWLFNIDHIAKIGGASGATYSRRRTLNNELWTFSSPLYSMKPSFLNLFMKKLTRGRVVPIISASVS